MARTQQEIEAARVLMAACEAEAGYDPLAIGYADHVYWLATDGDAIVGAMSACGFDWRARRCRGATFILPAVRRKGYARAAIAERNRQLFHDFNIRKVEAAVAMSNDAMLDLQDKAGAVHEGKLSGAGFWGGRYRDYVLIAWIKGG